jgi:hypothetical protein
MVNNSITDEALQQILNRAKRVVDGADIGDELVPIAFDAVLTSLLAPSSTSTPTTSGNDSGGSIGTDGPNSGAPSLDLVDRIAHGLNVDAAFVERVYRDLDGQPHLGLPSSKIPTVKSAATREIALLVVAARTALKLDPDDYIPVKEVKSVLEEYNRHDSANFASTIREMHNYFRFRGENQSRSVKLNTPGKEAAIELIKKLGGDN